MASEWPIKTIGDCASSERYSTQIGPFGKALMASQYKESGVPVLRGVNVNRGRFHDDDFVFINDETANRLIKFESFPGDVLLVHKGTLGQIGLMPIKRKYPRYIMGNSMMRVRCDPKKILPEYLYYWLSSPSGQHYLFSRVSQVGVPQIQTPLTTLRQAVLPVPPLDEQRIIVHILGTLDDKIELTRKMNETLESMACALFKSWFVDFDPVYAKAENRDSGLPKHIANLFPDSFVNSKLGDIPEGWKTGVLGDIADNVRRAVSPDEVEPNTPYIGLEHMPRRCIALDNWGNVEQVGSQKSRFNAGEILFGKLRPYFHKVGIAPISGVCSTDILVVVPKEDAWYGYVLALVSSRTFVDYTNSHSTGTKMPRINWQDMSHYPLILPPVKLTKVFHDQIAPLLQRIGLGIHQKSSLAGLREALLPKLLSGGFELPAICDQIKEVA